MFCFTLVIYLLYILNNKYFSLEYNLLVNNMILVLLFFIQLPQIQSKKEKTNWLWVIKAWEITYAGHIR